MAKREYFNTYTAAKVEELAKDLQEQCDKSNIGTPFLIRIIADLQCRLDAQEELMQFVENDVKYIEQELGID